MNQKNQKGITLIALVITIIVLLILAGVTISMVLGDDGIIAQAEGAKEANKNATVEERLEMYKVELEVAKNGGKEAKSTEDFLSELYEEKLLTEDDEVLIEKVEKELTDIDVNQFLDDNSDIPYLFKNGYLTGIDMGDNGIDLETVETVEAKLKSKYAIYNIDGTPINDKSTAKVANGMIIKQGNKSVGRIVVFGDIDSTISITASDAGSIRAFLMGGECEEYQILSMDINHDGCIDENDMNYIIDTQADGDCTYIYNQKFYVSSMDELILKGQDYVIDNYINALNSANNGYTITKTEAGYILNGVTLGTEVSSLKEALKVTEDEINLGKKKEDSNRFPSVTEETITAGTYKLSITTATIFSGTTIEIARFTIK